MKARNITLTLEKAKEWFNSGNVMLKDVALQAFDQDELVCNFKDITTFKKACEALGLNYDIIYIVTKDVATFSRASAAMFKLNIIRKALNLGHDLHLTKDPENSKIYYPFNRLVIEGSDYYKSEIKLGEMEVIGKFKSEGTLYNVIGDYALHGGDTGLSNFYHDTGVGSADAVIGFFGCASVKIARHLSKYFGMLITEAKYGDMIDFEII